MRAEEAVAVIGDRLLEMTRGDRGVHPKMIRALGRMRSAAAVGYLQRYAELDGAFQPNLARRTAQSSRPK